MAEKEKTQSRGCSGVFPVTAEHISDRESGFTLIEVLIAILIVTVGLLAVGTMQVSALNGSTSALTQSEAVQWGQAVIDEVLSRPDGSKYLRAGTHPMTDDPTDIIPLTSASNRGYTTTWDVVDNSPVSQAKTVTATVSWSGKGMSRRVVLMSVRPQL